MGSIRKDLRDPGECWCLQDGEQGPRRDTVEVEGGAWSAGVGAGLKDGEPGEAQELVASGGGGRSGDSGGSHTRGWDPWRCNTQEKEGASFL